MPFELLQHQREGIEWIRTVKRGLLGDEPGLGKSRQAIEAFDSLPGRKAIIAPAMVIHGGTWRDELEKWSSDPSSWTVVPYSSMNVRNGRKISDRLVPELEGQFAALVVDECHYTKGRNTYWTKSVEAVAKRSEYVLEMTGTPIPNWAHEMFTLLRVLDPSAAKPGGRLGSYWRWVESWFSTSPSLFGGQGAKDIGPLRACNMRCVVASEPCDHYRAFMEENFGRQFLRRLRDDCLDLPPVTTQVLEVPMDTAQAKAYRSMKKDYLALVDDQEVCAWTEGAHHVLLDKITTSPWLIGDRSTPPSGGKLERLRFDLAGRSRPTLVLAHYRHTVEACAEVARAVGASAGVVHGGIPKKVAGETIQNFKDGKLDVLVGSLETVAEGLQLTVADMAIFVESSYKTYRNEQARQRVHRLGQTRPVTILDYVTPDTVDANKRILLAEKSDHQRRMLTAGEFKRLL